MFRVAERAVEGPTTIEELFDCPHSHAKDLWGAVDNADDDKTKRWGNLKRLASNGLNIEDDYSGMNFLRYALHLLKCVST